MTSTIASTTDRPQSVDDVRELMRDAIANGDPLRIVGAATWRDAGPPIDARRTLSISGVSGIVSYVPGDLTITAHAGTTLAELAHATAAHGQWLGLDPAGDSTGTIGATIATASAGPLAHAFGTPRDLVLGIDAVTGYGDIVRAGGRVVKNVAGFDLVRLYTGSWGTLGAVTAVSLRLRALPVHDVTLALAVDDATHLQRIVEALRQNGVSLLACEWLDGPTAAAMSAGDGRDLLLLRLGGNDAFIRGQMNELQSIAAVTQCPGTVWGALAALDRGASAVVRVSGAVSSFAARVARVRADLAAAHARDVSLHGSVHRGMVRVIAGGDPSAARAVMQQQVAGEQRVVECAPQAWWANESDAFSGVLADRIRSAFDPGRLCNRRQVTDA